MATLCCLTHTFTVKFHIGHHRDKHLQAGVRGIKTVKQWFLVLLVIPIVSERLPFHQHQQRYEIADRATAFAADQFGDIWILLLRHDA